MKCNDPDRIILPTYHQNRKAVIDDNYQPRKFKEKFTTGLDTETYKGKVTLICAYGDELEDYMIVRPKTKLKELLEWLTQPKLRRSHNFFFNTSYDKDAFLKMLSMDKFEELIKNDITYAEGHKITLIGNKTIDISKPYECKNKKTGKLTVKTRHRTHFADVTRFFNRYGGLENTVKAVLEKEYKKSIDIGSGIEAHKITDEYIQYCMDDAKYTYELAKYVTQHAGSIYNINHYYSPATLSKSLYKQQMPNYRFKWNQIQKIHFYSYGGGRFEVFYKGFFSGDDKNERVRMADINSAYPNHMKDLYYPKGTHYINNDYEPDSLYSGYIVDIELLEDARMSPLRRLHNNLWVYPTGRAKDVCLCKSELELLMETDCRIKIKKGFHMKDPEPITWLEGIQELYDKRKRSKNKGENHIIKLSLNSAYGCCCEITKKPSERKESWTQEEEDDPSSDLITYEDRPILVKKDWYAGRYFNPIIASEVTARTRGQIYNDFKKVEDKIIMIQTDSVAMKGKLPVKHSEKLGGWGHYPELEGFVMASGIYAFNGYNKKDADFHMTKNRGVIYDIAKGEQIDLEKIFRGCMESELTLTKHRPKSLKECMPKHLTGNREYQRDMTNIFLPYEKTFNPNLDKKRDWNSNFDCFNDIFETQIDSQPLHFKR